MDFAFLMFRLRKGRSAECEIYASAGIALIPSKWGQTPLLRPRGGAGHAGFADRTGKNFSAAAHLPLSGRVAARLPGHESCAEAIHNQKDVGQARAMQP